MKSCANGIIDNMHKTKRLRLSSSVLLSVGMLVAAQSAHAMCSLDQSQATLSQHVPETLYLDLSDVQFNANVAVGDVIARKAVSIRQGLSTRGCSANDLLNSQLQSSLTLAGGSTLGPDIYATSVAGVGIRLSQRRQAKVDTFPFQISLQPDTPVLGDQLLLELIKTSDQMIKGQFNSGEIAQVFLRHDSKQQLLYKVMFSASPSRLQQQSCKIEYDSVHQDIQLQPLRRGQLKSVGAVAAQEFPFKIRLRCPESSQGAQQVQLGFSYPTTAVTGVVANSLTPHAAQGVGVQLLNAQNNQTIASGSKVIVDEQPQQSGQRQLSLIARYYQTKPQVTAGLYHATITFQIDYP